MTSEIEKFKLKVRNTNKLKRNQMHFSLKEAQALEREIRELEERIDKLEFDSMQQKNLSIDIVGREF